MKHRVIAMIISTLLALNILTIMPPNVFAVGAKSKEYEKDGYTVTYKIGSEWENNRTVEVNIKNTGDESILNWALKYNVGGEMSNLWNSKLYDKGEDYVIVKNNGYNYEIEPDQSVSCGYIVTGEETVFPEDIELCSRRIDVKSGYKTDFNVTNDWNTGFQAEVSITNTSTEPIEAWTLLFDGNFKINNIWNAKLLSSENGRYEIANQLWTTPIKAGESASFGFTADKSATENAIAENFQLTAVVIGESILEKEPVDPDNPEDIDYELDTDEDGLPDYYEEILGTDKNKADTDGDGLSDGYEVLYLGTDPLKADSDDNGINDGDEDLDSDGLTNLQESNLGTDPNNADTDGDGLSDGAEVNTHGTDPLKYDTDGDSISDADEIALGLNPSSGSTDGTPDGERTFTQVVSSDSEVLSAVNDDEETPFKVSLEMKSAGVAENNVYARESGYSNAIENSAIIGVAPEFVYTDGLAVEEVTVKFELDNSIINNTLGTYAESSGEFQGIKRFNVFMFFEDINMLLPIETFYDEENNIVYTTTDKMGTYCLMDMELWLNMLGIPTDTPNTSENEKVSTLSDISIDNDVKMMYNMKKVSVNASNSKSKDNFEVTFIVDEVNYDNNKLDDIKYKIRLTSREIWRRSSNVKINVYGMNCDNNNYGELCGTAGDFDALNTILTNISYKPNKTVNPPVLSKLIDEMTNAHGEAGYNEFVFVFFNAQNCNYDKNYGKATIEGIVNNGKKINISVVSNVSDDVEKNTYAGLLFFRTDGINISEDIKPNKFKTTAIEHIYGEENVYDAITALGYERILLDAPITKSYKDAADDVKVNNNANVYKNKGFADTDSDGLMDFQEIDFDVECNGMDLIQFNNDGSIRELPLATICCDLYVNSNGKKPLTYVENGWRKLENSVYSEYISDINILPIKSDPTRIDGDKDGISDADEFKYEMSPLKVEGVIIDDTLIDDSDCIGNTEEIPVSYCFDGSTKAVDISKGDYKDDSETYKKPALNFNRLGDSTSVFLITPDESSDYIISSSIDTQITVEEKNFWGRYVPINKESLLNSSSKEVKLALNMNKNYRISIKNDTSNNCTIIIQQDNWVYAPNGGYAKYDNAGYRADYLFFTKKMMDDMCFDAIGGNEPYFSASNVDDEQFFTRCDTLATSNLLAPISLKRKDQLNSFLGNLSTGGGAATTFGGATATALGYSLVAGTFEILGIAFTAAGVVVLIENIPGKISDYEENLAQVLYNGDANVIFMHARSIAQNNCGTRSDWTVWNREHYINKYYPLLDIDTSALIKIGKTPIRRFDVNTNFIYTGVEDVSVYLKE